MTFDGQGNVEHEDRELAGAARSAQVLHVTSMVGGESARLLRSALVRAGDAPDGGLGLLVVARDRQNAYEVAALAREPASAALIAPLTVPSRASRLLQRDPKAVVGTVDDLLALVRSAALKLATVRQVVLLWPESTLEDDQQAAELEILVGEVPREADRALIVEKVTPKVEAFTERLGIKPRRIHHETPQITVQRTVNYVVVAAEQRAASLLRLLDARDGVTVAVAADSELAAREAGDTLAALGIDDPALGRVISSEETTAAPLIVWYGPPAKADRIAALTEAAPEASEIVALVTAEELRRLRSASGALRFTPFTFPQLASEAARRQRALHEEIATLLRRESVDADLAAMEPLLATHDPAEVAAAALRLLGRARKIREQAVEQPEPEPRAPRTPPPAEQAWTRLFLSVGERDGARRGDLVGAITGEAGITGAQVGKIEMRDTYSLVDVASGVADKVVERLTGVMIRGRRVTARLDRGPSRSGPADARRPGPRREASEGSEYHGVPRAAREHQEWSARAERLRHARRPPGGDSET